jgi:hypothetical protein
MGEPKRYRAYLLRLWRVDGDDGGPVWRASLEEARSGERHGFADLARLYAFLDAQTARWAVDADEPPEREA